jgi:hypothetical protein
LTLSKNVICCFAIKQKGGKKVVNNSNICWECRHDSLKLQILVPQNHTIKEYAHKIGALQSNIIAISKEKQGQYNILFRLEGNLRLLSFKMLHVCKLKRGNEKNEKVGACGNYDLKSDHSNCSII